MPWLLRLLKTSEDHRAKPANLIFPKNAGVLAGTITLHKHYS